MAVLHYKPEGFAGLVVFVGAYTLTHSLQGLNWASLARMSETLVALLAPVIHLGTLMMVQTGTSGTGLVFTFLLPGIAQANWLGIVAGDRHLVSSAGPAGAAWLALLGIRLVSQIMLAGWHAPSSHRQIEMRPLPKLKRPLISNTDR